MNKIPVIRKGTIKDYWVNGVGGGFIVGLIFFLITLIANSVRDGLVTGLALWIGIVVLFIGVGFPSEEYFKRKKRIKELTSPKYAFLDENGFTLHPDLYFDGLVSIFHRVNLQPFSKEDWKNTHGRRLDEAREKAEKAATKQILKIGKLDIKYRKPE